MSRGVILASVCWFLSLAAFADDCKPAPEVVFLQDGSGSVWNVAQYLSIEVEAMLTHFRAQYSSFRFGFSVWTDKAIPFRGYGNRNVIPQLDFPYVRGIGLTDDPVLIQEAIAAARPMHGGDFPEDPYEALLYAALDPMTNWSSADSTDTGSPSVRILAILTDDVPHYEGEGQSGILRFRAPRYPKDVDFPGGFGHESMLYADAGVFMGGLMNATAENYLRMTELWYRDDDHNLTEGEREELDTLRYTFGPAEWPDLLPHPGDFPTPDEYSRIEYPSLAQVGKALRDKEIKVVMMLTEPQAVGAGTYDLCTARELPAETTADVLECTKAVYAADFQTMGIDAVVTSISGVGDLEATLTAAIGIISDDSCPQDPIPYSTETADASSTTPASSAADASSTTPASSAADASSTTHASSAAGASSSARASSTADGSSTADASSMDRASSTSDASSTDRASSSADAPTSITDLTHSHGPTQVPPSSDGGSTTRPSQPTGSADFSESSESKLTEVPSASDGGSTTSSTKPISSDFSENSSSELTQMPPASDGRSTSSSTQSGSSDFSESAESMLTQVPPASDEGSTSSSTPPGSSGETELTQVPPASEGGSTTTSTQPDSSDNAGGESASATETFPASGSVSTTDTNGHAPAGPNHHGGSTGKIAGAAGGAVGGAVALGIAAYKHFGAGTRRRSEDSDVPEESVDAADAPMERETMENIHMDMFN